MRRGDPGDSGHGSLGCVACCSAPDSAGTWREAHSPRPGPGRRQPTVHLPWHVCDKAPRAESVTAPPGTPTPRPGQPPKAPSTEGLALPGVLRGLRQMPAVGCRGPRLGHGLHGRGVREEPRAPKPCPARWPRTHLRADAGPSGPPAASLALPGRGAA